MKAVLFDLDNTLTHRKDSIAKFSEIFVSKFSHRLKETKKAKVFSIIADEDNGGYLRQNSKFRSIKEAVGHTLYDNLKWTAPPPVSELIEYWVEFMPKCSVPVIGVPDILIKLKNLSYKVGVVSNGAHDSRTSVVNALKIDSLLDVMISSEKASSKKPDSIIFNLALDELGIKPSEAWFIGDHPVNDVIGAQNAGIMAIWLSGFHDWPDDYEYPEHRIDILDEVLQIVC